MTASAPDGEDCGDRVRLLGRDLGQHGRRRCALPRRRTRSRARRGVCVSDAGQRVGERDPDRRADRLEPGGKVRARLLGRDLSDGNTIVAGAPAGSELPGSSPTASNTQGTVDVFTTTGNWASTSTPNARLTVSAPGTESTLGGELGWSVAISGNTIVAGAPYDATYPSYGEAYVFVSLTGGWSGRDPDRRAERERPHNPAGEEYFGWSVGVSGTTIVVGALSPRRRKRIRRPGRGVCVRDADRRVGERDPDRRADGERPRAAMTTWVGRSRCRATPSLPARITTRWVRTSTQGAAYVFVDARRRAG